MDSKTSKQPENVKSFTTGKPTPKQAKAWAALWQRLLAEPKQNAGSQPSGK